MKMYIYTALSQRTFQRQASATYAKPRVDVGLELCFRENVAPGKCKTPNHTDWQSIHLVPYQSFPPQTASFSGLSLRTRTGPDNLLQTTNMKWFVEQRQFRSPWVTFKVITYCKHFQMDFSYSYATIDKISTDIVRSAVVCGSWAS